jgi:CelD/BcsL family acetyltransferase involved in cellulose biosynthesis
VIKVDPSAAAGVREAEPIPVGENAHPEPGSGPLAVEVVDTEAGFDTLRDEWNELVSRLELPSPFQSWEWQRAWWRQFPDPRFDRLRLVLFRDAGSLRGIAPFKERRRFGVTELSVLGWRDRITELGMLLFPPPDRERLLEALWSWLSAQSWTSVGLPLLGEMDPLPIAAASHIVSKEAIVLEHLVLPKSWEELERGLNRSMRSNVRYYPKLIARKGHTYSFEIAKSPDDVAAALPTLWDLHTARAAARTKVRHLDYMKPPSRRAFLHEVAPLLAARGEAAIGMLRVDGNIVAAQLWLERDRHIFLYYSGFEPTWARYSVAMVTTAEILNDAISRGVERVEFLRGANHFKSRWGTESRIETEVLLARRPLLMRARERYRSEQKALLRRLTRWQARLDGLRGSARRPA